MESNLIIKQFQENNITIYGTFEKPLFKAKDIGDLLGIEKIRKTIENLDEEFKILKGAPSGGGLQDTWFLTIDGLYEVLFISRKPIAKEFRKWVRGVIEEVRKTGKYESQKYIENKAKSDLLVEQSNNKSINYIGVVEENEEKQIVKYGRTNFIKDTLSRHQVTYGEDFYFLHTIECDRNHDLEKLIQNHTNLKSRHLKSYNGTPRQELLKLDKDFTSKDLINLIGDLKETLNNNNELRRLEIESRTKEIEAQEKTKQAQEKTKQLQIELELKRLELSQKKLSPIIQESSPILPQQVPVSDVSDLLEEVKGSKILLLDVIKRYKDSHLKKCNGYNNYNGYSKEFKDYVEDDIKTKFDLKAIKNNGKIYYLGLRFTGHTSFYNCDIYVKFIDNFVKIPEDDVKYEKIPPGFFKYKVEYDKLQDMFYEYCKDIPPLFEPRCSTGFTCLFKKEFIEMVCKICDIRSPSYSSKTIKYFNGITFKQD